MVTTEDHALSVRLPNDLYEQLRKEAFEKRTTQADIIRAALQRHFAQATSEVH